MDDDQLVRGGKGRRFLDDSQMYRQIPARRTRMPGLVSFQGVEKMAQCPVCDAEVELSGDVVVGELMECPDCGTELEVLETDPPELGEAPETEEDWGQ